MTQRKVSYGYWGFHKETMWRLRQEGKTYWQIKEHLEKFGGKKISVSTVFHWCNPKKYLTYKYHRP